MATPNPMYDTTALIRNVENLKNPGQFLLDRRYGRRLHLQERRPQLAIGEQRRAGRAIRRERAAAQQCGQLRHIQSLAITQYAQPHPGETRGQAAAA